MYVCVNYFVIRIGLALDISHCLLHLRENKVVTIVLFICLMWGWCLICNVFYLRKSHIWSVKEKEERKGQKEKCTLGY